MSKYVNEFKVGERIRVYGSEGIVTGIHKELAGQLYYDGKPCGGESHYSEKNLKAIEPKGYTFEQTGTCTYLQVAFDGDLKNTAYDGGWYGGLDDVVAYGEY